MVLLVLDSGFTVQPNDASPLTTGFQRAPLTHSKLCLWSLASVHPDAVMKSDLKQPPLQSVSLHCSSLQRDHRHSIPILSTPTASVGN